MRNNDSTGPETLARRFPRETLTVDLFGFALFEKLKLRIQTLVGNSNLYFPISSAQSIIVLNETTNRSACVSKYRTQRKIHSKSEKLHCPKELTRLTYAFTHTSRDP